MLAMEIYNKRKQAEEKIIKNKTLNEPNNKTEAYLQEEVNLELTLMQKKQRS